MSPVAHFGAAALGDLGAVLNASGGEGAAETGERDPRSERTRKRGLDTEANGSRSGGAHDRLNLELSGSPWGAGETC